METRPSDTLLTRILRDARTIAVVGASRDPQKDAHTVPAYLQGQGYRIIPINPHADSILGEKAYASLDDLPDTLLADIDLVLLFRPSEQVGDHIQTAIQRGIRGVWMQQGIRNREWAQRARAAGLTVVEDLCIRTAHMLLIGDEDR